MMNEALPSRTEFEHHPNHRLDQYQNSMAAILEETRIEFIPESPYMPLLAADHSSTEQVNVRTYSERLISLFLLRHSLMEMFSMVKTNVVDTCVAPYTSVRCLFSSFY